jgi:hypothetical protein
MHIAHSVRGVPIRPSTERSRHIGANHPELQGREPEILETIAYPDRVVRGSRGTLVALKKSGKQHWLWVYYKELGAHDGFVITALISDRPRKGKRIWPRRIVRP